VTLSVFVVDDEPLARRKLAALVGHVAWAKQIGEASDGLTALENIRELRPDIVFLDIEMPEISGIEVAERLRKLEPVPAVVFTTAYDRFAVTAFELEAVDYLLKPFGEQRLVAALERARGVVETRGGAANLDRARTVLAESNARAPLERIFVRDRGAIVPLALRDVLRIEAQDDYVMIHTRSRQHLVSLRIRDLEQRLPDPPFLRVHRSHIVNLDHVERMVPLDDTRLEVQMKDGVALPVSRARSREIRRLSR
jgi:two-component system, LytTR family, response regulator